MLLLGRWVRGNPLFFFLPSPALEVSRPIVHLLGFRVSPKIPTSDVCLRQALNLDSKLSILAWTWPVLVSKWSILASKAFPAVRLARVRLARARFIGGWLAGLSPPGFRVLPFLSRKVLWTHSLYECGSTPPIGAKACSCTCRAGPRGLNRPFSWGCSLCPAQPWCFLLPGVFGVPATLLRMGAAKMARVGI